MVWACKWGLRLATRIFSKSLEIAEVSLIGRQLVVCLVDLRGLGNTMMWVCFQPHRMYPSCRLAVYRLVKTSVVSHGSALRTLSGMPSGSGAMFLHIASLYFKSFFYNIGSEMNKFLDYTYTNHINTISLTFLLPVFHCSSFSQCHANIRS